KIIVKKTCGYVLDCASLIKTDVVGCRVKNLIKNILEIFCVSVFVKNVVVVSIEVCPKNIEEITLFVDKRCTCPRKPLCVKIKLCLQFYFFFGTNFRVVGFTVYFCHYLIVRFQ